MKNFENAFDFAEEIIDKAIEGDEYFSVTLVADSNTCGDVMKELLDVCFIEDLDATIEGVELDRDDDRPYYLTVTSDLEIWIQCGVTSEGKKIFIDDDVVYVTPEFREFLKELGDDPIVVTFGDDAQTIELIRNEEDKVCGFRMDNEAGGKCFHVMYCSCEPLEVSDIGDLCDEIMKLFLG